jgi:hypothetical protein
LNRLRDRLDGELEIAHVFGDSQSKTYFALERTVVRPLPGTTMHRVGRDEVWFLDGLQRRMGRRSTLVFVFGGIDARRHIGGIAEKNQQSFDAVVKELCERYLAAIARHHRGRLVVVVGVLPPAANEAISRPTGAWGTQEERAQIVRLLNQALATGCRARGFGFADVCALYSDERGYQLSGLSTDGVHLNPDVVGPLLEKVRAVISATRAGGNYYPSRSTRENSI